MSEPARTGLTLVLGPANSGKLGRMLGWWEERLPRNPVVVTPTVPDAQGLSAEMTRRAGALVGQSPAVTFDGLVRLVLGRSPRYATDLERTLLVRGLLRDTPVEALRGAVDLPGVATALDALLRQLGESGRTPPELERIFARWAAADPDMAVLAGDVRRLAAAYAEALSRRGLTDRPAAVLQAAQIAAGWARPVALYGFTSFTPVQRILLEALSRQVEVLITFTHDRARDVNLITPGEISWWEARAAEVVEVAPETRAYESAAIAYLERYFMSDGPRPEAPPAFAGCEGVRFLLASGERAEAELAAEQISQLLRDGLRPGEIAVVVRQVRKWGALLGQVFDSCGIPYQMDERCVLSETGIGHAFLNVLKGVALDDAGSMLGYLRSPYSGFSLEDVSDLELRYRRGVAKGGRVLVGIAKRLHLEPVEGLWAIVDMERGRPGSVAPRFDAEAAGVLARRILAAGLRHATVGSREIEEDARAFRALSAALATMADAASGDGRGFDPLTALRALADVAVPGGRVEAGDAVQILSVQRARARRFEAVVVLGLVEGEFPGRPDTPSLLSAVERARLDAAGGGLFPPEVDEEAAFFVSAISRASRLLLLSARDAEDDGSEAAPSHFWESAKQLLGVAEDENVRRTLADQVFSPGTAPSLRHYLRACAACGLAPRAEVAPAGPPATTRSLGAPPSRLTAPAVLAELAAMDCFSPSALEKYASCPFTWFVEQVVGAKEVELELDGRMIGQLAHSALSDTYGVLSTAGLLPLREEGLAEAERVADAAIEGLVQSDECPGTVAERRLAGWRLRWMARNLFAMEVAASGRLVLFDTERRVGGWHGVDIGGLRVRGRIDRIDVAPDGEALFVFDYKSGGIPAPSDLGTAEGLQLPLYLMALAAEGRRARVSGGAYLSLPDKARSGVVEAGSEGALGMGLEGYRILDQEGLEELFRATREVALEAVAGMRAGVIAPRPDRECPWWCELGPACRARRGVYRP